MAEISICFTTEKRSNGSFTKSWYCLIKFRNKTVCGTPGLRDDYLKDFLCKILEMEYFDEEVFNERVDHIEVTNNKMIILVMKDGSVIRKRWNPQGKAKSTLMNGNKREK